MIRKPNKHKPPFKFEVRSVKMSELSLEDQLAIRQGLADMEAGRVTELQVPKPKGLKVKASRQALRGLSAIPADHLKQILQCIVNDCAAQKRRKNTKPKLARRVRK